MVRHRSRKLFLIASAAMLIAQQQASGQLVGRHHHEHHHVGNVSCAVGNCPTNILTYGYFRENWRRWPEETPEPQSRALTPFVIPDRVPFKPIVPDARDEASQRVRDRQPIQATPEDASTGFTPQSSAPATNNNQQSLDFDSLPEDTSAPATETNPAPVEPTTPAADDDIFGSPDPLPETPADADEDEFDLDSLDLGERQKSRDRITSLNETDGVGGKVRTVAAEVEVQSTAPADNGSPQFTPTAPLQPATTGIPRHNQPIHRHPQSTPVKTPARPVVTQPQLMAAGSTAIAVPAPAYPVQAMQPPRYVGQPVAVTAQPQTYAAQPVATTVHPQPVVVSPVATHPHQPTMTGVQPNHLPTVDARPLGQVHHQATQYDAARNPLRFQENPGTTEPLVSQPTLNQPAVTPTTNFTKPANPIPAQSAQVTAVEQVTAVVKEEAPKKVRPRLSSGRRNPLRQR